MNVTKRIIGKFFKYGGIQSIFNALRTGGVHIITIHRVLPTDRLSHSPWERKSIRPESLKRILEYLSGYRIIGLEDAVDILQKKTRSERGERPFLVVTFDDGYFDFYQFAFPILRELKIPATLFLATRAVERKEGLWWEEISLRMWFSPKSSAGIPYLRDRHGDLRKEIVRFAESGDMEAWAAGQRYIRKLPPFEKSALLEAFVNDVPVDVGRDGIAMVSVESVKEMAAAGISIQAHTQTHCYLDEMEREELECELIGCKERLESWTGNRVDFLAYPAGRKPGTEGMEFVRKTFRAAFTTRPGLNYPGGDLFSLKRKDVSYLLSGDRVDRDVAEMELGGIFDYVWQRPE